MKKVIIELNERDVQEAIKEYTHRHYSNKVKSMQFYTSTRGDYDRGDAEEYVRAVICECEQ